MKKKWIYIRVSTLEQANNWFWKDLQLTEIKKYLKYNYWDDVEYEVYNDLWISWWKDENERPWLKKMINDIEDWVIDTVIVWKLNRIARKTIILLELVEFFNSHKITFISIWEKVDTQTPTWNFFLTVIWAIAEMEREDIKEKTRLWKIEALKNWNFSMWWTPMFWFKKNIHTKKIEINEEEAEIVREIYDMYINQNKTLGEIVIILNSRKVSSWTWKDKEWNQVKKEARWHTSKVSRILSDEAYIWIYYLNKTWIEHIVEKWKEQFKTVRRSQKYVKDESEWIALEVENIIESEIFYQAQKKVEMNKYRFNNNNKPVINHIFSWLLKCSFCSSNYKWEKWKPKKDWSFFAYYRCWRTNWYRFWTKKCDNSQIRETELIDNVYDAINKILSNPKNVIEDYLTNWSIDINIKKYKRENEDIKLKLDDYNTSIWNLYKEWSEEKNQGLKNILKTQIDSQKKNIEILEERFFELSQMIEKQETLKKNSKEVVDFIKLLRVKDIYNIPREEQMDLLTKMIDKIIIKEDEVEVYFVFHLKDNEEFEKNNKKTDDFEKKSPAGFAKMVVQMSLPTF